MAKGIFISLALRTGDSCSREADQGVHGGRKNHQYEGMDKLWKTRFKDNKCNDDKLAGSFICWPEWKIHIEL